MKLENLILILLIIITLINFYYFTYGRKIKLNNKKHFEKLQFILEKKYNKFILDKKINPTYKKLIVSDDNSGFIIIIDKNNDNLIFIEENKTNIIKTETIESIEKNIKNDDKYLFEANITIQTNDNIFTYFFGTKKRKLKSVISKFIIDNCNSTHSEIIEILEK